MRLNLVFLVIRKKRYVPCIQYVNSLHKFQVFCFLFYWLCLHSYEISLPLSYGRSDPTPSTNVRSTERQMWSRGSQIHQVWAQIISLQLKCVPILQFTKVGSWNMLKPWIHQDKVSEQLVPVPNEAGRLPKCGGDLIKLWRRKVTLQAGIGSRGVGKLPGLPSVTRFCFVLYDSGFFLDNSEKTQGGSRKHSSNFPQKTQQVC